MRSFALAAAFVLALGTLVAADQQARPFEVSIVGNANPVPDPGDPCVLLNTESAVIHGTHLGKGTWDSFETVNFCTNPGGPAAVEGEFTLTAANGDQIFGTYTTLLIADPVAGTIEASGEYQITGGTGRFDDATGSGTISATGDFAPPFAVVGAMSGEISY
jgi:hypothetical protein